MSWKLIAMGYKTFKCLSKEMKHKYVFILAKNPRRLWWHAFTLFHSPFIMLVLNWAADGCSSIQPDSAISSFTVWLKHKYRNINWWWEVNKQTTDYNKPTVPGSLASGICGSAQQAWGNLLGTDPQQIQEWRNDGHQDVSHIWGLIDILHLLLTKV